MHHHQFESELAHLELISPLFSREGPFAVPYWRTRITALLADQYVIPSGARRITWLLDLLDEVERLPRIAAPRHVHDTPVPASQTLPICCVEPPGTHHGSGLAPKMPSSLPLRDPE